MKTLYETLGGTYREENGHLVPELELPEQTNYQIGKYGQFFVQLIIDVDKICDDYKISLNSWMPGFTNIVSNNIELLLNKLDLCQFNRLFEFFETIKTSSLKKELINSFGSQILLSAEKVWKTEDLIIDDVTAKLINNINKFKKDLLAYSLDSKQFTGLH